MTTCRARVIVRGRVQGVFFRATCAREAGDRGLAGWVRNRSDGAVEAVFEGPSSDVEALVEWCRLGPRGAVVSGFERFDEPPAGGSGFHVSG